MNKRILLLILFFSFLNSFSQEILEFNQLSGENSSTQSITYAIKKDKLGNLWIASEEGILKNNSKTYKLYNTYNGLPESLSNRTSEIFIDKEGNVFAGLEKGVCVYNRESDKFDLLPSKNNINPSLVGSIDEDSLGNIWIGGFNGLWKFNHKSKLLEATSFNKPIVSILVLKNNIICGTEKGLYSYSISQNSFNEIVVSNSVKNIHFIGEINENILVGTKNGSVFSLNNQDEKFTFNKIEKEFGFPIKDIIQGNSSNVFIATDGNGIYELNNQKEIIKHYLQDFNKPKSLSSNGIYDIELDQEGIMWVATYGGGINYYNFKKLPFIKIQHELNNNNSLSSNFTRSVAKDTNGSLWFGTKNGLSIWNTKKNTWKHIKEFENKKAQVIVLAIEPDEDYMWIGTYNYGLYKINVNNFKIINFNNLHKKEDLINRIYTIKKDSKGTVWVGGIDKDLIAISKNGEIKKLPILQIKNIIELQDGSILASGRYGIHKINPTNYNFQILEDLEPSKKSLAFSTIQSVQETTKNNLVIGSNGAGLIFFNSKTKEIKKLNVNSGLPSDILQGVLLKNDSTIWTSTTKGLVNIITSQKDTIINVFDKKDGLASTEYNYGSSNKLGEDLFAFGGVNGVTLFNPNNIISQKRKPILVLDEFKLFNKVIKPSEKPLGNHINTIDKINLKHNENSISLDFTGIQHSSPNKMKYSWILEGFDETWSKPTKSSSATYTNLESNNYIFKVKAINKFDVASNIKSIKINVSSPWWLTNIAFVIYFILSVLIIYAVVHFTTVMIHKKNADDQIEFFNNITHEIKTPLTILMSSLENVTNKNNSTDESNKHIKTTVKRLNSLFEQMLNFHKVTSQDTIYQNVSKIEINKYLEGRIKNFKPLTEERNLLIEVENHWPKQVFYNYRDVFDKIILNLLSNAIKYSFDNGTIKIKLDKTNKGDLKFQISDEGLGIPKDQQKFILKRYYRARNAINSQKPGTGLGLIMTKKLIEKTGGNIAFESIENKGTTFTVVLKNLDDLYKESAVVENESLKGIQTTEDQLELDRFSDSKILIVEDNDELRSLLVETLGNYFLIFEASNGVEGIEMASQNFPDIILTDLIMPEMDGMEMAKKLKEDISLNHIPVFMLTVLQNSNQKLESIESGVSEYLEKPVDTKLLLAKIINTLKFQRKLREKYIHDNDADNASLFRNQKDQDFLQNLEDKIIENIENNSFSVHDLSASFGMSRTSLYMKLKNLVDLSPQDFIIHTKLKHAKSLLIKGELSIKEVAYSSGFSNPKYFSTSFKKFYGITPSGFLSSLK